MRSNVKNNKGREEGKEKGRWEGGRERGTEEGWAGGRNPQGQRVREEKRAINWGISESKRQWRLTQHT